MNTNLSTRLARDSQPSRNRFSPRASIAGSHPIRWRLLSQFLAAAGTTCYFICHSGLQAMSTTYLMLSFRDRLVLFLSLKLRCIQSAAQLGTTFRAEIRYTRSSKITFKTIDMNVIPSMLPDHAVTTARHDHPKMGPQVYEAASQRLSLERGSALISLCCT